MHILKIKVKKLYLKFINLWSNKIQEILLFYLDFFINKIIKFKLSLKIFNYINCEF